MVNLLQPSDLTPFASIDQDKAMAMIEDAEATAATVAPCILEEEFLKDSTRKAYVKAVVRGAVLRWNESGTGAYQAQTAGPFGVTMDTRQQRRGMFFPSEIEQLQEACKRFKGVDDKRAYTVNAAPSGPSYEHSQVCDYRFRGDRCTCGVLLTRDLPLYERDCW